MGHVLDAKVTHSRDILDRPARIKLLPLAITVEEVALGGVHSYVARPVELRADLTEIGQHQLVVEDEPLGAEGATRWGAGNGQAPAPPANEGDIGGIELAKRGRLALLDQLGRT